MRIVVTGGAGFIGSCVVRALNDRNIKDIIIVDDIASTEKWKNLVNKEYSEYIHKSKFLSKLDTLDEVSVMIHLGACSATTEKDFDYLWENNVEYTKILWEYCCKNQVRFIYASSAATYGDGANGFSDTCSLNTLMPLNGYGYSKHVFDKWAERQTVFPKQYAGLKFFNVYGPNEYCKGSMASMVYHGYRQIMEEGKIKLFKSERKEYQNGGQLRDFIYVKDICNIILAFIDHPEWNGLYNAGTGKAHSFKQLAEAVFHALGKAPNIAYIDMPVNLREKYQYFTKASMDKLLVTGYQIPFYSLERGVADYVQQYLAKGYQIY